MLRMLNLEERELICQARNPIQGCWPSANLIKGSPSLQGFQVHLSTPDPHDLELYSVQRLNIALPLSGINPTPIDYLNVDHFACLLIRNLTGN